MEIQHNEKSKELELTKKLAVLGWIMRKEYISMDEYSRIKRKLMNEYDLSLIHIWNKLAVLWRS